MSLRPLLPSLSGALAGTVATSLAQVDDFTFAYDIPCITVLFVAAICLSLISGLGTWDHPAHCRQRRADTRHCTPVFVMLSCMFYGQRMTCIRAVLNAFIFEVITLLV